MNDRSAESLTRLAQTRKALHGVAELLLAGPQFDQSQSIELRVSAGGFATTRDPDVRVDGGELVVGERHFALHGRTLTDLSVESGLPLRPLRDVYADGPDLDATTTLEVDDDAAAEIAHAYALGDGAMQELAPERPRILWPEHFDVGVDQDGVNYGVSPGDSWCAEPYAYVGPWDFAQRAPEDRDAFWNAPFGAARTIRELGDEDGVLTFFEEGRRRA